VLLRAYFSSSLNPSSFLSSLVFAIKLIMRSIGIGIGIGTGNGTGNGMGSMRVGGGRKKGGGR
jgi:hypothetical protein